MDAYQKGLLVTFIVTLLVAVICILGISSHISLWGHIPPGQGRVFIVGSMLVGLACLFTIVGLAVASDDMPPWATLATLCFSVFYVVANAVYVLALLLTYSNLATPSCVPTVLNWAAASVVGLLIVSLALVGNESVSKSSSVTMVAVALTLAMHAVFTDAVLYGHTFQAPHIAARLNERLATPP